MRKKTEPIPPNVANYQRAFYNHYMNPLEDRCGDLVREIKKGYLSAEGQMRLWSFSNELKSRASETVLLFIVKHAPTDSNLYINCMINLLHRMDNLFSRANPNISTLAWIYEDFLEGSPAHKEFSAYVGAWRELKKDMAVVMQAPDHGPGGPS